jgi:opacity protein-like surface antigen
LRAEGQRPLAVDRFAEAVHHAAEPAPPRAGEGGRPAELDAAAEADAFGMPERHGDRAVATEGELSMDYLVGAFANLNFPVSDRLDLSARAGYAFVSLDSTAQTAGGNQVTLNSGTDDGLAYGVGATFDMTEAWNLRAGYTRFDFDEADADSVDLTLQYKF